MDVLSLSEAYAIAQAIFGESVKLMTGFASVVPQ